MLDDGGGDGFVPSTTTRTEPHTFTGRQFGDPLFAGNMAIRRAAFDALGTFDERLGAGAEFPGSEDNDFGFRLLEAGWAIRFVPDAVVRHRGARHGRELLRLDWAYARGQGAFYAKHRHASDRFMWRRFGRNARSASAGCGPRRGCSAATTRRCASASTWPGSSPGRWPGCAGTGAAGSAVGWLLLAAGALLLALATWSTTALLKPEPGLDPR